MVSSIFQPRLIKALEGYNLRRFGQDIGAGFDSQRSCAALVYGLCYRFGFET